MSAETLRRAASLMRERAEAATPGSWEAVNCEFRPKLGSYSLVHDGKQEVAVDRTGWRDADVPTPNAEHIASWHPAVALAVADWLEAEAVAMEFDIGVGLTESEATSGIGIQALAVARAYLGESS